MQAEALTEQLIKLKTRDEMSSALFTEPDKKVLMVLTIICGFPSGPKVVSELLSSLTPVRAVRFIYPSSEVPSLALNMEVNLGGPW